MILPPRATLIKRFRTHEPYLDSTLLAGNYYDCLESWLKSSCETKSPISAARMHGIFLQINKIKIYLFFFASVPIHNNRRFEMMIFFSVEMKIVLNRRWKKRKSSAFHDDDDDDEKRKKGGVRSFSEHTKKSSPKKKKQKIHAELCCYCCCFFRLCVPHTFYNLIIK